MKSSSLRSHIFTGRQAAIVRRCRRLAGPVLTALLAMIAALWGMAAASPAWAGAPGSLSSAPSGQTSAPTASCPPDGRCFADVSSTNPYYTFINNIYRDGVVTGYACGGPGEPCDDYSRPYFRPFNAVPRQQMAKFADLARKQPGINIDTSTGFNPIFARTSVANGRGIQGESTSGNGLHGVSGSNTASGVFGQNTNGGFGVAGRTNGTGSAVFGDNNTQGGFAGNFNGNVRVVGNLSKGGGAFEIDHPLDPANKYLYHSFVESPDMMNIYNGISTLDANGEAWVAMPAWFEALNRDFRYQLTAVGAPGPNLHVAVKMQDNRFKIAGGKAGMEVSWEVTGIRHDPYADKYRIPVEKSKTPAEQGRYLHPELYGQPDSKQINTAP